MSECGADIAGLGLHGLGPADFAPFRGDKGVERHVLGFEGGHRNAAFDQTAAETGGYDRFAHIRSRAAEHDRARMGRNISRFPLP